MPTVFSPFLENEKNGKDFEGERWLLTPDQKLARFVMSRRTWQCLKHLQMVCWALSRFDNNRTFRFYLNFKIKTKSGKATGRFEVSVEMMIASDQIGMVSRQFKVANSESKIQSPQFKVRVRFRLRF